MRIATTTSGPSRSTRFRRILSFSSTYRATSIYLNRRLLAEIDSRKFAKDDNQSITIDIPPKTLSVGDNHLLIRTGWCQYDIDVLRLNNLVLVHE